MNRKPYKVLSFIQLFFFVFIALAALSCLFIFLYQFLNKIGIELGFLEGIRDSILINLDFFIYGTGYSAISKIENLFNLSVQMNLLILAIIFVFVSIYAIRVIVYSIKGMRGKCDYYYQRQTIGNIFVILFALILIFNFIILLEYLEVYPFYAVFNIFVIIGVLLNLILKLCGRGQTLKSFGELPPPPKKLEATNNVKKTSKAIVEEPVVTNQEEIFPEKKKRGRKPKEN